MKYDILSHNPAELKGLVNEKLAEGWRPHGSATFLAEPNGSILALQPMTLAEPGDEPEPAPPKSGRR
jgi:hypothetical protein